MENILILALFVLGLLIIIKGGDMFVDAAIWLAKVTGVPNVFIGSTIVSVATTLPELFVSSIATYQEQYDVAVGNVVGSVVCNIGLILGLTALISPIDIKGSNFKVKGLFMFACSAVVLFLLRDTIITSREGLILLLIFITYIILNVTEFKKSGKRQLSHSNEHTVGPKTIVKNVLKFSVGAVLITVGAKLLVDNGVELAKIVGVPEQIVSLTLIALGTSLPELTTAITSIVKKEAGISIGNIIGANILNMAMVLGLSAQIAKQGVIVSYQNIMLGAKIYNIPQTLYFDLPVAMLLITILVVGGIVFNKINRLVAFSILSIYIIYLGSLAKLFL